MLESAPLPVVEVLPSAKDQAAEDLLLIDPTRHQVFRNPSWHWFDRCAMWAGPSVRLGVYRHRVTGRFVLGVWAYAPDETDRPILQELEGFQGDPHVLWPFDLPPDVMYARLQPVHDGLDRAKRALHRKLEARRLEREESLDSRKEASTILRKRGLEREALDLDRGAVPYAKPSSDSVAQFRELAKGV